MDDSTSGAEPGDQTSGVSRRQVLRASAGGFGLFLVGQAGGTRWVREAAAFDGGPRILNPRRIPKFQSRMPIPAVMPTAQIGMTWNGAPIDYYEISVRQFTQQLLPPPLPRTTVWGYGAAASAHGDLPAEHSAPSPTIEAEVGRPVRVKWINDLVDDAGHFRPHLLPVDPFLHWANPGAGLKGSDDYPAAGTNPGTYRGPVPLVTHLHGAATVGDESDGFSEAWFLPDADNIPSGYARHGRWFSFFRRKARSKFGVWWARGSAVFQYPNDQRAGTSWFHDHTLGITRLNVYAGPLGFYLLRGGPAGDDSVIDTRTGQQAVLPGPGPRRGDPAGAPILEIPMAIQDRTFTDDGSLFYPSTRAYFDEITGPYQPTTDMPPIWNPEFFGNTILVNAVTWPWLAVEQRRYRLRILNACNSRFLMLDFPVCPCGRSERMAASSRAPSTSPRAITIDCCLRRPSAPTSSSTSPMCRSAAMCCATSARTSPTAAASRIATTTPPTPGAPVGSCSSASALSTVSTTRPRRRISGCRQPWISAAGDVGASR
jgi:spore coat protein A